MAFLDYSGLSHFLDKLKQLFLAKNQGSTNVGKFMKVGNDGTLVPDNIPDPSGKADKVTGATAGDVATLDSNGNLVDSSKTLGISVPANAVFTDTTYESKTAASGGTDVSLVTTGEKYTWNSKLDSNQGSGNSGKYMKVDTDGSLIPDVVPLPGDASTSVKGIVQLEDSTTSTAIDKAATPNSVKTAKDAADTAASIANEKADPSSTLNLTAAAGSWSSATPPTQTLTATGVTSSNNIIVGIASTATSTQYDEAAAAKLVCTAQGTDSLTFTCYGTEPTGDIPISVLIVG